MNKGNASYCCLLHQTISLLKPCEMVRSEKSFEQIEISPLNKQRRLRRHKLILKAYAHASNAKLAWILILTTKAIY